jgi:tetratricopeptide (TPR) repeat protein
VRAALALAVLLCAAPAGADTIWDRITADEDDPRSTYEREMQRAEDYLELFGSVGYGERRMVLDKVQRAYENAIAALPDAAEPHLRLAKLLYWRHLEGRIDRGPYGEAIMHFDRRIASQVLGHWKAFEDKAPLDPRITREILFDRAIVHTKMGTDEHYEKALADYLTLLDRAPVSDINMGVYLYNAAETLMMLGRLDEAIPMYERSLRHSSKKEYAFSLAVALDRDGQGARGRDLLSRHVEDAADLEAIIGKNSDIFFVPTGELYYYLAITYEVIGDPRQAVFFYDKFIRSGAHPRYHPRAREHLERLEKEVARR